MRSQGPAPRLHRRAIVDEAAKLIQQSIGFRLIGGESPSPVEVLLPRYRCVGRVHRLQRNQKAPELAREVTQVANVLLRGGVAWDPPIQCPIPGIAPPPAPPNRPVAVSAGARDRPASATIRIPPADGQRSGLRLASGRTVSRQRGTFDCHDRREQPVPHAGPGTLETARQPAGARDRHRSPPASSLRRNGRLNGPGTTAYPCSWYHPTSSESRDVARLVVSSMVHARAIPHASAGRATACGVPSRRRMRPAAAPGGRHAEPRHAAEAAQLGSTLGGRPVEPGQRCRRLPR